MECRFFLTQKLVLHSQNFRRTKKIFFSLRFVKRRRKTTSNCFSNPFHIWHTHFTLCPPRPSSFLPYPRLEHPTEAVEEGEEEGEVQGDPGESVRQGGGREAARGHRDRLLGRTHLQFHDAEEGGVRVRVGALKLDMGDNKRTNTKV